MASPNARNRSHLVPLSLSLSLLCTILSTPLFAKPGIASQDFTKLTGALKDQSATDKIRLSRDKNGFAHFVGAPASTSFAIPKISRDERSHLARKFLQNNSDIFGLQSKHVNLDTRRLTFGRKHSFVRFQQLYDTIPIFGAEIIVELDDANDVASVLSDIMTDTTILDSGQLQVVPTVPVSEAQEIAIECMLADYPEIILSNTEPTLTIYEPYIVGNSGLTRLVWKINITGTDTPLVNELVLVDAHTGDIALHFSEIFDARNRQIHDSQNTSADPGNLVRSEGQGTCGIADADSAYVYFGDSYDFYQTHHRRDSINGLGIAISASVRFRSQDPRFWNNAWWDGNVNRFYFDAGWPGADDVVAHEYTHGVTQYNGNGGLIYLNESGAINESFSDIWGEFVDLENGRGTDTTVVRWLVGEDLPGGEIRDMADPPQFSTWYGGAMPDRYNSPDFYNGSEDHGGVHHNSSVGNKLCYLLTDGDTFNGHTVVALGIAKVADLFYNVQTNRLHGTADYEDLGNVLLQAAIALNFTESERTNVAEACRAVEIMPSYYIISASAGLHGYIEPSGNLTIPQGNSIRFSAFPDVGYEVGKWYLDGEVKQVGGNDYTISNLESDHALRVTFQPLGGGGNITVISPNGGEIWFRGRKAYIAWDVGVDCGNYVRIELFQGSNFGCSFHST